MKRVFISYKHADPDTGLALALAACLRARRLHVFLDTRIEIGSHWEEEIDRELKAAHFFLVLLSAHSIRSEWVKEEVSVAVKREGDGKVRVIPIRIGLAEVPLSWGALLNRFQYASWKPEDPVDGICEQIIQVIHGAALPEALAGEPAAQADALTQAGAPFPEAELETGAMPADSRYYIKRRMDEIVEARLPLEMTTLVVKGSRQSGKSSLMARAFAMARARGQKAFYLDFQVLDDAQFVSLHALLMSIAQLLAHELRTPVEPEEVWNKKMGDVKSFEEFVEVGVLPGAVAPVILCFDEVDRVFERKYRDSFFRAVRGWHNRRAISEPWRKLTLILGHSTEPKLWIQKLTESPFNVGLRLRLPDFQGPEIAELNGRYGRPLPDESDIAGLMQLTGGHPYLTRQALYTLRAENLTLPDLTAAATRGDGPFSDHLSRLGWVVLQDRRLTAAVKKILAGGACDDEAMFQRLSAGGIVKGESRAAVEMRCELYARYLKEHL